MKGVYSNQGDNMQIDGIDPYSTYIPPQTPPEPAPEEAPLEETLPPEEYVTDASVGNNVDTTA